MKQSKLSLPLKNSLLVLQVLTALLRLFGLLHAKGHVASFTTKRNKRRWGHFSENRMHCTVGFPATIALVNFFLDDLLCGYRRALMPQRVTVDHTVSECFRYLSHSSALAWLLLSIWNLESEQESRGYLVHFYTVKKTVPMATPLNTFMAKSRTSVEITSKRNSVKEGCKNCIRNDDLKLTYAFWESVAPLAVGLTGGL